MYYLDQLSETGSLALIIHLNMHLKKKYMILNLKEDIYF